MKNILKLTMLLRNRLNTPPPLPVYSSLKGRIKAKYVLTPIDIRLITNLLTDIKLAFTLKLDKINGSNVQPCNIALDTYTYCQLTNVKV